MTWLQLRQLSRRFSTTGSGKGFFSFSKAVAFVSVMLGSMALVVSLAVLGGFEQSLHSLASQFSSHVQLHSRYLHHIQHAQQRCDELKQSYSEIRAAVPVVQFEGLVYRRGQTEGIVLKSDLPEELSVLRQERQIVEGSQAYSGAMAREILLGKKLARRLACHTGDTVILSFSRSGLSDIQNLQTIQFKVQGVYESGMAQYDDVYAYAPLGCLQALYHPQGGMATSIDVWLYDELSASSLGRQIEQRSSFELAAITVDEIHRGMFAWIELQKRPVPIVLGLISIVAVFNILTTLLISTVEKSSSYAILLSLGMKPSQLLSIVAWQGLVIGLLGSVAGCAIALSFCLLQEQYHLIHLDGAIYFVDTLPVLVSPWHYLVVLVVSSILSLAATLIPGMIASRISPIAALRFK